MSIAAVKSAFRRVTFESEATKAMADFGLEQLEAAIVSENARLQMEWFDKLIKLAQSSPTKSKDVRLHRAKALVAYRRNKVKRKGYGKGANDAA